MITGDKEMRLDHFLQQILQFELSQMFLSEKKKKKEEREFTEIRFICGNRSFFCKSISVSIKILSGRVGKHRVFF